MLYVVFLNQEASLDVVALENVDNSDTATDPCIQFATYF